MLLVECPDFFNNVSTMHVISLDFHLMSTSYLSSLALICRHVEFVLPFNFVAKIRTAGFKAAARAWAILSVDREQAEVSIIKDAVSPS